MSKRTIHEAYIFDVSENGQYAFCTSPDFDSTIFIPWRSMGNVGPSPIFEVGGRLECTIGGSAGNLRVREAISYDEQLPSLEELKRVLEFEEIKVGRIIDLEDDGGFLFARARGEEVFVPKKAFYSPDDFDYARARDLIRGVVLYASDHGRKKYKRNLEVAFPYLPNNQRG